MQAKNALVTRRQHVPLFVLLVLVSPSGASLAERFDSPHFSELTSSDGFVDFQIRRLPPVEPAPEESGREEHAEQSLLIAPEFQVPIESEAEEVPALVVPDETNSEKDLSEEVKGPQTEWDFWEGSFEAGINGSSGNTESHNFRIGMHTERNGPSTILNLDVDYKRGNQESVLTSHRFLFEIRNEWLFNGSPWSAYFHGALEWDEFRAFDTRVTDDGGLVYLFFKNKLGLLKGRAGAGATREFGGPDDRYVPEGVVGLDYERKLTKRQKLSASVEYFFDWTDHSANRINAKADWEVTLDEEANLRLKLGVIDRYDSTPNGAEPNDVDYSAVLLWSF